MSRTVFKRFLTAVLVATAAAVTMVAPASAATAQDVVSLARANVGKHYCDTNSLGGRGYESSCTAEPWCADFLKWVWGNHGLETDGLTAGAASFYLYGQRKGTLHTDAGYVPQPGDAVVFNYNGAGYADHVGMVTKVDGDRRIEVINGNFGNSPTTSVVGYSSGYGQVGATIAGQRASGFITPVGLTSAPSVGVSSPIAVGSDGLQMVLMADGTVLAKHGIGLYGWTRETDARVAKIATNGGVQMILDKDGTVWAKNTVGLYDWVYEADPVVTDIAVGNDGTQMILKNDGTVWAKNTIGLYGWTQETDGIASAIAAGANGLQMILTTDGTVHAKTGIGLYGWTRESDATVTKIATNGGVQMILDKDGAVSAKTGIGLYGWTFEADRVTLDIAVGSDGTQMIRKNDGTVYAKNTIGTYGWTFEADAGTHHIATNAGIQLIVHPQGTVYARQGIDTYGWTLETDNIK